MLVDSAVYRGGTRLSPDGAAHDFVALRRQAAGQGGFAWIGVHEPSPEEMHTLAAAFGLHHLAVEDALHAHQRPKLELYEDMVFLVLKTLWYVDTEDAVETGQIAVFLGSDFVVSVRIGEGTELGSIRRDLEAHAHKLGHGPSAALYAICDRVVDDYEVVVASLQTDVDEVEESVFSESRTQDSPRIYTLKRELLEMRRAVAPLREPMALLVNGEVPLVAEKARPFLRDVADHVTRVMEEVDSLDALLGAAFQAYLAQVSVRQNEDMRKISAWVAIGAAGTLVAGIYGMNFEYMPELAWRYGYFLCLGLMLLVSVVLFRLFKRSGWL